MAQMALICDPSRGCWLDRDHDGPCQRIGGE